VLPFLIQQGFRSLIQRLKTEGLIDDGFDVESVPKMTITAAAKAPGEETSAPAARPTSSAAKPIRRRPIAAATALSWI